jgi:hypothetical protein
MRFENRLGFSASIRAPSRARIRLELRPAMPNPIDHFLKRKATASRTSAGSPCKKAAAHETRAGACPPEVPLGSEGPKERYRAGGYGSR